MGVRGIKEVSVRSSEALYGARCAGDDSARSFRRFAEERLGHDLQAQVDEIVVNVANFSVVPSLQHSGYARTHDIGMLFQPIRGEGLLNDLAMHSVLVGFGGQQAVAECELQTANDDRFHEATRLLDQHILDDCWLGHHEEWNVKDPGSNNRSVLPLTAHVEADLVGANRNSVPYQQVPAGQAGRSSQANRRQ